MKFCTHVHVPQNMNPTGFGDPLTFDSYQQVDILAFSRISQKLLDGLT